jgi:hypothetical protein
VCKYIYILPTPGLPGSAGSRHVSPHAERHYVAAAAADGGCLALNMTSPYNVKPGEPDPNALPGSKPVQVGRHRGYASRIDVYYTYGRLHEHFARRSRLTQVHGWMLDVQVRAAHGQERDIIFLSTKLPLHTVIKIAKSGLG